MTSVTVIIPTYNRAHLLTQALDSIFRQTLAPSQVIVVDDGSTDDTQEALRSYHDRIEYLPQARNRGKAAALNAALPKVRGDFVWIFDDDDIALPHSLESQIAHLRDDAQYVYSGWYQAVAGPDGSLVVTTPKVCPNIPPERLFLALLDHCFLLMQGMLIRSSCFAEVGEFDVRLVRNQDYEMLLRLAYRFRGTPNPNLTFVLRRHAADRGTAAMKVPYDRRTDAWAYFDRAVGTYWRDRLRLCEYLDGQSPATELSAVQARTARITRASIMARKGLWGGAVDDLCMALDCPVHDPLNPVECQAIRRMTRMIYWKSFRPLLSEGGIARRIRHALRHSSIGRSARSELLAGLGEELHDTDDWKTSVRLLMLGYRLVGARGLMDFTAWRDLMAPAVPSSFDLSRGERRR